MILITGATGPTGADIARLLGPRGDVRVLLRDPAKSAGFDGCEVAIGDFSKPHTLPGALEGVDKVLLISPLAESMAELQGKLITAAKQAGVKHLVRISSAAADVASPRRIGRWHGECDRLSEASGIPFTHIRACNFMQNLLSFANEIAATGGFSAPMADGKISLVDRRDVAAVAAAVLTGTGHEGRAYGGSRAGLVVGDELLAQHLRQADGISACLGVHRSSGGEGHDDRHRLGRIGLGKGGAGMQCRCHGHADGAYGADDGERIQRMLHVLLL